MATNTVVMTTFDDVAIANAITNNVTTGDTIEFITRGNSVIIVFYNTS